MREHIKQTGTNIPSELLALYKRIEHNAGCFGMSPTEVAMIKRECKIAFQHKIVLDKIAKKKK